MISHRLHQQLLALSLPVGWFLTPMVASGQSTWNGTTSTAWNVATNWSPGIPAEGANIIIADTTPGNNLTLDTSHAVGSITFGTTGTRTTAFTLQTTAANTLTMSGGFTGNFGTSASVIPTFRGNFVISQNQTISITGGAGSATADAGMFIRSIDEATSTTSRGSLAMNGNITKEGTGQLVLLGLDITGAGNFIVNNGALKFNAGGNQPINVGGTGNVTMNGSSILMLSRNSGTFTSFTRPVIMNDTTSLQLSGNTDNSNTLPNSWNFNLGSLPLNVGRVYTLSGPMSGAPVITRTGTGTLTLTGDNSAFTGTILNNAGTLNINSAFGGGVQATGSTVTSSAAGSIAGDVSVNTTSTVTLNGSVAGSVNAFSGTLAANGAIGGNLFAGSGVNLSGESAVTGNIELAGVNLSVPGGTAGSLHAATDLTISGTNTVSLTGAVPLATPIKVVSYDDFLVAGDETNFALAGGATAYRSFSFTNNTVGKSIDVSVTAGAVTWTGAASATWDINTSPNWTGTSDKFFQLDAVTFPNVASNKLINLPGNVSPSSITFQNDLGSDYSISGTGFITGGTSITKNGTGVTLLGGANGQNYTGAITVNAGVLRMGSRDAFGANSGITVASGAQVDIGGQAPGTVASGGHTYTIAGTGPSPANTGALVNTLAGVDQGAGVRHLILSANATLGGTGRFDIGRATAAGAGTITGNGHTLTCKHSGSMGFRGDASATPINIVVDSGIIWAEDTDNALGGATGTVTVNSGAKVGTFGTRTIATPVTLNAGGILHNQGGATGTWTGTITLAGAGAGIEANGQNVIISGNLTESGGSRDLIKTGTSRLIFTSTAGNTGNTTITNGFVQAGNGGTTGAINGNPIDIASATSGFIVNRSDDVTISNVISGTGPAANASNPGAVSKEGAGTLTLTAANTYTGLTRFGGGTVAIGSNNTVFGIGGLLDFRAGGIRSSDASNRTIDNPVSYSADMILGSAGTGNLLFTGAVGVGGGNKMFTVDNAVTEFSGIVSGTGAGTTLTKAGTGTLIFSNDNTYTQTTTISTGVLQVGNGGGTGSLSTTAVINNASLVINRTAAVGFTTFDFNNVVSGTGTLTYSGPDTILVNGNNTYTGDTIITDGTFSPFFAYFGDSSVVKISGDAKLDLFHNATDTVGKFFIDGTAQAIGKWGRIGSIAALGADFETPFITSDGLLNVTSTGSATPYDDWATSNGLTAGNNAPTANPDGDGYVNLAEFALNGNPLSGATGGKVVVKLGSVSGQQALTLTLPVRTAATTFTGATSLTAAGDGVTYTIEAGDTLTSWGLDVDEVTGADATAIQAGLPAVETGWTYRTFRSVGAVAGDPIEFIRARVE